MDRECKAEDARKATPFFLYLPYTSPHKPVIPIEKFRGQGRGRGLRRVHDRNRLAPRPSPRPPRPREARREHDRRLHRRQRPGEHLETAHRESLPTTAPVPIRGGKRSIYEGGHRVPFFLRWPARVKPGSTPGISRSARPISSPPSPRFSASPSRNRRARTASASTGRGTKQTPRNRPARPSSTTVRAGASRSGMASGSS